MVAESTNTSTRLKIGDLAKQTGVAVGTLRYYETLGLLTPAQRGANSYRYYLPAAIQQVQFIKKAQMLGFSLDDIHRILVVRDSGQRPCELVQSLLAHKIEHLETQIEQMSLFKSELETYQQRWQNSDVSRAPEESICPLIATVPLYEGKEPIAKRANS